MRNLLGRYNSTGLEEDNLTYLRGSSFVGGKSNIGTLTFVSLAHFLRLSTKDTLELSLGTVGRVAAIAE